MRIAPASRTIPLQYSSSSSSSLTPPCCASLSTSKPQQQQQQDLLLSSLQKHPLYSPVLGSATSNRGNLSLEFKEKILCLEIMGIDSGKALSHNPLLHSATLPSIHSVIAFLESKGIHQKDLPRILGMCPGILTADIKSDLDPVFSFLSTHLRVPDRDLRRVINKCPRLLVSSVRNQLKPALLYLRRLGFEDIRSLAYQDAVLLVSSVENTLIPKLEYLVSLGFGRSDVVGMVLRCPALFTFSVENNFKPKFEYYSKEMGGGLEELKEFPQYFAFSLEKRIKPRHSEAVRAGVPIPLPLLLKTTDEEFRDLIITSIEKTNKPDPIHR